MTSARTTILAATCIVAGTLTSLATASADSVATSAPPSKCGVEIQPQMDWSTSTLRIVADARRCRFRVGTSLTVVVTGRFSSRTGAMARRVTLIARVSGTKLLSERIAFPRRTSYALTAASRFPGNASLSGDRLRSSQPASQLAYEIRDGLAREHYTLLLGRDGRGVVAS